MNGLTHVDLCAGGGGFSVVAGWAGFRTVAFSEIEPFPCYVLSRLFPGVPNLGDLRRIAVNPLGTAPTLLTGGIPCQPASQAGKGLGSADPRWLWDEAIRLLGVFRPRYAVFENPAGILTVRGPDGRLEFPRIVGGLRRAGYHVWWQDLSAAEIGASHGRERIWIVCVRMDDAECSEAGRTTGRVEAQGRRPHHQLAGPSALLADPESALCGEELAHPQTGISSAGFTVRSESSDARSGECSGSMANSNQAGSQGLGGDRFPLQGNGHVRRSSGTEIPQHPPGPADLDGWRAVLAVAPHLAPAVEPGVCWLADGLSLPVDTCRAAVLSLLGNAIHPETVYPILAAIAETERGFQQEDRRNMKDMRR